MISEKIKLAMFSLGAIVLFCIGATGIVVVQTMAWIKGVVGSEV